MQPLRWPTHDELYPPERGDWECIGPLGRLIYVYRWGTKQTRIREFAAKQLEARTDYDISTWGDDIERQEVVRVLSEEIVREMRWPNGSFLPEDPVRLLFIPAGVGDGAEWMVVEFATCKRLGITGRPADRWRPFWDRIRSDPDHAPLYWMVDVFVAAKQASAASHPSVPSVQ